MFNRKNAASFVLMSYLFSTPFLVHAEDVKIIDPAVSTPNIVYRNSSAHNRIDKKFSATFTIVGAGPSYSTWNTGFNLGVYLSRNSILDFEVAKGRPTYFNWFGSDYDITTSSAGVHYKHFASNSFYFRIGVDYRKVDYRYTGRDFFNNSDILIDNSFKGESFAGTVLIGNQWQWKNFTLGCDWFGYAFPFTSRTWSEKMAGSRPEPKYLEDDKEDFTKRNSLIALRFYLGATF